MRKVKFEATKSELRLDSNGSLPKGIRKTTIDNLFSCEGYFHQWNTDPNGSLQCIVETLEGKPLLIYADKINFTSPPNQ